MVGVKSTVEINLKRHPGSLDLAYTGLNEAGLITWKEWAEYLGGVIREAELRGEYDTGKRYYEHWLTALERFAGQKNFA